MIDIIHLIFTAVCVGIVIGLLFYYDSKDDKIIKTSEVCKFCGCAHLCVCEDYDIGINEYFWFLMCLDCFERVRDLTYAEYKILNKDLDTHDS